MQDPSDLVFALCHEVGNLVGAIRLHADRIDAEASPVELASAAVEIDDSSARIRSWLALVRPLLGGEQGDETGVAPADLLRGVAEAVDELGARGVSVETALRSDVARARGRLETLHHLLATLAFCAVEAAQPEGAVRLALDEAPGGGALFSVEDDGREDGPVAGSLTGRALAVAVADAILGRLGGGAALEREGGRSCVWLRVPAL